MAICPTRILLGFVAALAARSGRGDAGAVRLRLSLGAAVRAGRGRERAAAAAARGLDPLTHPADATATAADRATGTTIRLTIVIRGLGLFRRSLCMAS